RDEQKGTTIPSGITLWHLEPLSSTHPLPFKLQRGLRNRNRCRLATLNSPQRNDDASKLVFVYIVDKENITSQDALKREKRELINKTGDVDEHIPFFPCLPSVFSGHYYCRPRKVSC
ncbi:hypothetical protein GOODEAATRI_034628, partial [Goodea atripinnis]